MAEVIADAFKCGPYDTNEAFAGANAPLWEDFVKGVGPSRIFVFYQIPYKTD